MAKLPSGNTAAEIMVLSVLRVFCDPTGFHYMERQAPAETEPVIVFRSTTGGGCLPVVCGEPPDTVELTNQRIAELEEQVDLAWLSAVWSQFQPDRRPRCADDRPG